MIPVRRDQREGYVFNIEGSQRGMQVSKLSFCGDCGRVRSKRVLLSQQSTRNGQMVGKTSSRAYLQRRQEGTPFMYEFCKGTIWTTLLYLSKTAKDGQLVICHAHVSLTLVNTA